MKSEQNHKEAELLARLARIEVRRGRIPALAAGLGGMRALVDRIGAHDLGRHEPASRFRAPSR